MNQDAATHLNLLPELIRRRLEGLSLVSRKARVGAMQGDRRSVKRGSSVEFADYRNYAPGDDLRQLDWNIYARLEKPFIKLLEDEEDLSVHLLLDASASMDFPRDDESETRKLLHAKRIAAALGYMALSSNDRLTLTVSDAAASEAFGPARGRGQTLSLLRFLDSINASGVTDLNAMLGDYARRTRRPGLALLISDMFSPNGYLDGLNALLSRGHEAAVLHLLSPQEVTPPLAGDLRLIDVETGAAQEVSVDEAMRGIYTARLEAWREEMRQQCGRRGVWYFPLVTDSPWERLILSDMRRVGLVK